jgi:hypothetical protein
MPNSDDAEERTDAKSKGDQSPMPKSPVRYTAAICEIDDKKENKRSRLEVFFEAEVS